MLLQIFKVEKNYFSIKGLKTKGLKNLAGEESVKESLSKCYSQSRLYIKNNNSVNCLANIILLCGALAINGPDFKNWYNFNVRGHMITS